MAKERRQFSRSSQPVEAHYRLARDLGTSWMSVTTVNISAAGVRFRGPDPVDAGVSLELRLQLPGSHQPLEVRGRVVWSKMQASGVVECGVEFLDISVQQQTQIDRLVEFLGKDPGAFPPP